MISSKILVQSAAAGLMAGAILTSPLFVFGPEDSSLHTTPCPNRVEYKQPNAGPLHKPAHYEPPVLRPAPEHAHLSARRVDSEFGLDRARRSDHLHRRSLEERNQAANQALQQINKAYEHSKAAHSKAKQSGAQAAHSVTLHTLANQEATRVRLKTNAMVRCNAGNRNVCLRPYGLHPRQRR